MGHATVSCNCKILKIFFCFSARLEMRFNPPSEPIIKWCISGPDDILGTWQLFWMTPRGDTILTCTTCNRQHLISRTYTQLQKKVYSLFFDEYIYSKYKLDKTYARVWGSAHWSSTANGTELLEKFQVVPKFWRNVWRHVPVIKKSMGEKRFMWTFCHDMQWNFSSQHWNHLGVFSQPWLVSIGAEFQYAVPHNLSRFLLDLHFESSPENKVYTFFWSRVYTRSRLQLSRDPLTLRDSGLSYLPETF